MREEAPYGTLGIRPTTYVLIRAGQAVLTGEYSQSLPNLTIVSGPLKDEMGVASGVLDDSKSPRYITFTSEGGTLSCREIR